MIWHRRTRTRICTPESDLRGGQDGARRPPRACEVLGAASAALLLFASPVLIATPPSAAAADIAPDDGDAIDENLDETAVPEETTEPEPDPEPEPTAEEEEEEQESEDESEPELETDPAPEVEPQPAPKAEPTPELAPAPVPAPAPAPAPQAPRVPAPAPAAPPTTASASEPRVARAVDPVLTSATPNAGSIVGGTRVQITGQHFLGADEVLFGGIRGTDIQVVSSTELWVTTPARGNDGNVNVRVFTAAGGRSAGDSPVDFRFVPIPALTRVTPSAGSDLGGTLVLISGTELNGASSVTFGDTPAQIVTMNQNMVRVVAPPRQDPGPVDVRVTTLGGTTVPVPDGSFVYAATPVISSTSPDTGTTEGGTMVTLRGANLEQVSEVTFGGEEGSDLEVISGTQLRVKAPERTTVGEVPVTVTTDTGISAEAPESVSFDYEAPPVVAESTVHSYWPLGVIGILSWSVWFIRRFLSRHRYRVVENDFRTTTSVVVPVYREDPDVLERCLRTWLREDPTEVILVVDDLDDALLEHLHGLNFEKVHILEWHHTGKRGALGAGVRRATGEVVVFADSDTEWRPGMLASLQMPFVDPKVGGVGSRQHVYLPQTNVWRRVAYWMLNTRYLDYVPAMSRRGGVACLSGRTAAYRRSAITPLLPALEHEIFLGRQCVAGDDGRLTWLVLASGFTTVHQDTAQADSMFPDDLKAFLRQRVRWSRNSYRCYLTAASQGWLWGQPFVTQVTVLQILLTPISMGATIWYATSWIREGGWIAAAIVLAWAIGGRALRGVSHLMENPREIVLAPLVALTIAVIALPIKLWAGITMNKQGWLTRQEGQRVQGQQEIRSEVSLDVGQG
ncbi:IPT/TIG domain-containing protein [Salinibacterium sp. ZJ454]|uniref:IPT/TIG domain-containing protein n=1 Tax=Salinibacterium sp. ZJ454 TaxID=2708339 RepID=UPI001423E73A|nr:IPT/TIG domain-containing protein [Salinibacterium sp. ZJ454]